MANFLRCYKIVKKFIFYLTHLETKLKHKEKRFFEKMNLKPFKNGILLKIKSTDFKGLEIQISKKKISVCVNLVSKCGTRI